MASRCPLLVFLAMGLHGEASGQQSSASRRRALHWSLHVSDLLETLQFTKQVLGMHVLRHEDSDTLKKTYVGYGPEARQYSLELISSNGNDHARNEQRQQPRFVIRMRNAADIIARAAQAGYAVDHENAIITGPDGYGYQMLAQEATDFSRDEPFEMVVLRTEHPSVLADWYSQTIGMSVLAHHGKAVTMAFDAQADVLFLIERAQDDSEEATPGQQGQSLAAAGAPSSHTLCMPAAMIRAINERVVDESTIVHPMGMELEAIGMLFSLTLRGTEGHEVRLLSTERFNKAAQKYGAERHEEL